MGKRRKDDETVGTGAGAAVSGPSQGSGMAGLDPEQEFPTLTEAELSSLMLAPGVEASEEALDAEEGKETRRQAKNKAVLSTGRKLQIVGDLGKGMTPRQVGKKYGIGTASVIRVAQDPELYGVTDKTAISITKKLLAARFYQLTDLALSHIDPDKLKKMEPYRLAFMAAISLDKARLLEGESTENLSFKGLALNIHATLENLKERKKVLLDKVAELGVGRSSVGEDGE